MRAILFDLISFYFSFPVVLKLIAQIISIKPNPHGPEKGASLTHVNTIFTCILLTFLLPCESMSCGGLMGSKSLSKLFSSACQIFGFFLMRLYVL